MSKHKTYTLNDIPFNLKFKTLPTPRLLNFYKKIKATESKIYEMGYCCEVKHFHYLEESYKDDNAWPKDIWEKVIHFRKKIKTELNSREHINT